MLAALHMLPEEKGMFFHSCLISYFTAVVCLVFRPPKAQQVLQCTGV